MCSEFILVLVLILFYHLSWASKPNLGLDYCFHWSSFIRLLIIWLSHHSSYHIIPRPALTDELRNRSFTMFGRGQRTDLDDDEAAELIVKLRAELAREVERIEMAKGRL